MVAVSRIARTVRQWSIVVLGSLLLVATTGRLLADSDEFAVDVLELSLPFVVAIGVIIGGRWVQATCPTRRVVRIARWIVGGAVVGLAVTLWFVFIVSLDRTPTGEFLALQLNGVAVTMGAGAILGYYYTGLKQREQTLALSEARFRALTENSPLGVVTVDDTSTIRYANDAVEELFGYPADDIIGEPLTVLAPDRLRDEYRDAMNRSRSDGHPRDWDSTELTGRHADGDEFPVEVSFGEYIVDGECLFTGVIRDSTDRKRAVTQLQTHMDRVTRLHEIATDLAATETTETVYQRAVDGAADVLPCDVARVAAVEGEYLVPTASSGDESLDDSDPVPIGLGYAGQSYRTGQVIRIDDLTDTRSTAATTGGSRSPPPENDKTRLEDGGTDAPVDTTAVHRSLLSVPLGEYGVLQVFATEPDAFDDQCEELAELLATHVTIAVERVAVQATIRQERDRLEEFASVLSHDIRNPLNVAQGRLQFARDTGKEEHFAAVERAHTRIERLIDDLLALARQGDTLGATEPVVLEPVAEEAWANVATEQATLRVATSGTVEADRTRLMQLFENLYRNAVKHGGPAVTVTVGQLDHGFYVEDTGPGIPPDERDRAFERGYTTSDEGTGFGLTIVERIVEAHGWEVDIAEGSDGGARFEITTKPHTR